MTTRQRKGRVFTLATLREKGVIFHPNHVRRLVAEGKFPPPFYMTARRPAWTEAALDEWLEQLETARASGAIDDHQRARREAARSAALKGVAKRKAKASRVSA